MSNTVKYGQLMSNPQLNMQDGLENLKHSKQDYLDFLGSRDFVKFLDSYSLEPFLYNRLFCSHAIAIASQCRGLKTGHLSISYWTRVEDTNFLTHKIDYGFFTNRYALINKSRNSTHSSDKISHPKDFMGEFNNAWQFKNFLNNYLLKLKPVDQYSEHDAKGQEIKISYKKIPNSNQHTESFFESIIDNNPELERFLSFHFLQRDLQPKNNSLKQIKI